ncbi:MAG TPA: HAMP domain-containing sensor histidine kinase [Anaerolineales bacterium]|nr:HAMP domain-containing sensor histidine kinase [Anaerolineales bacterium]
MFTSLRTRLWLSYALLITVALSVVVIVLFIFLIRNPVLNRETQQRLKAVQTQIMESPRGVIGDSDGLTGIAQANNVRILLFNSNRNLVFDSNPDQSPLPFPRRNVLGRNAKVATDGQGGIWLFTTTRLPNGGVLVVAAPRPSVKFLNVFTDEFMLPILEGGAIALLLSLVLAFGISRWVADPLQQVVLAARNYPQGSGAGKPVVPRGPQEVQDLTRAFNSMISRVLFAQRSQRDFVANVSHELKTPLTSIQGFAQAILDDTADTPELRRQAAQVIYEEAARMHRMALDLLDLARLEGGTADLDMSSVDIRLLIQNIVEKFSLQAQKANVNLISHVSGNLPDLIGDGDRLSQVFTNLVDNALKFTPPNGQVTLSARVDQAEMEISVTDSGQGVPADALPRLFDRFYQVDSSRAGGEKHGAGLGLAIAQEIVQAHGGKIGVRSLVGQGTTFVIRLPLAQS